MEFLNVSSMMYNYHVYEIKFLTPLPGLVGLLLARYAITVFLTGLLPSLDRMSLPHVCMYKCFFFLPSPPFLSLMIALFKAIEIVHLRPVLWGAWS